jgi:hypothetical protein
MAAIISTPKLQTPTFILLCNLALTDFAIGFVIGSTEVVYLITRAVGQYGHFCNTWKVIVVLSYFLCPASLYTITSISYDRYLSLLMNVKYKTVVTRKKAYIAVVLLWVWSALGTTLMGLLGKVPFLILACCITFFCLVVIIDCYLLCFAAIKRHQKLIKSSTLTRKSTSKSGKSPKKEDIRLNRGRKGLKRPLESFGRECEELKRIAKSRDADTEEEDATGDYLTEQDDTIGQWDSKEDFYNKNWKDLDEDEEHEKNETRVAGVQVESLSQRFSVQKTKEHIGKRRQTSSSANRKSQFEVLGKKVRHTHDPTKLKYDETVHKDMESVIENIEIEGKHVRNVESEDTLHDEITGRNEVEQEADDTTEQNRLQSLHCDKDESTKLTIQKSELLADVKQFEKSLRTILIIVVALFLCYLPYLLVNILISLHVIDSGVSKNSAAIMIYRNSSINSFIMCTRISGIRKACGRILRKVFCMK